jgi:hypothetical protein
MLTNAILIPILFVTNLVMACAMGLEESPATLSDSGIEGLVLLGPICPTTQQGQACPDEPFATTLTIQARDNGDEPLIVSSGKDGKFRISLTPGEYTLTPISPNPGAPPYAEPQLVRVEPGQFTHVTVKYESGIR